MSVLLTTLFSLPRTWPHWASLSHMKCFSQMYFSVILGYLPRETEAKGNKQKR